MFGAKLRRKSEMCKEICRIIFHTRLNYSGRSMWVLCLLFVFIRKGIMLF